MNPESKVIETIETPLGTFLIYSNGTFLDQKENLQWIRSSRGMVFKDGQFIGEPIRLTWKKATRLFGRGSSLKGSGSVLSASLIRESKNDLNYKVGSRRVEFAGFSDWRLPTAFEINRAGCYLNHRDEEEGKQLSSNYDELRVYSYSGAEGSQKLRDKLFFNLRQLTGEHFWCANDLYGDTAWAIDGKWPPGDHVKSDLKCILMVRNG